MHMVTTAVIGNENKLLGRQKLGLCLVYKLECRKLLHLTLILFSAVLLNVCAHNFSELIRNIWSQGVFPAGSRLCQAEARMGEYSCTPRAGRKIQTILYTVRCTLYTLYAVRCNCILCTVHSTLYNCIIIIIFFVGSLWSLMACVSSRTHVYVNILDCAPVKSHTCDPDLCCWCKKTKCGTAQPYCTAYWYCSHNCKLTRNYT